MACSNRNRKKNQEEEEEEDVNNHKSNKNNKDEVEVEVEGRYEINEYFLKVIAYEISVESIFVGCSARKTMTIMMEKDSKHNH